MAEPQLNQISLFPETVLLTKILHPISLETLLFQEILKVELVFSYWTYYYSLLPKFNPTNFQPKKGLFSIFL